MQLPRIYICGTGNIAWHLITIFNKKNIEITSVISREKKTILNFTTELLDNIIITQNSIVFLCVPDDEINPIAKKFATFSNALLVHCSGAKGAETEELQCDAVFYPLQTFTKNMHINWEEIPVIIHSQNSELLTQLQIISNTIGSKNYTLLPSQFIALHTAAVFANNFTNAMLIAANDLLTDNKINVDLIKPLINQTTKKWENNNPLESQTGPASRGDLETINKHSIFLNQYPLLKNIYTTITQFISNKFNK